MDKKKLLVTSALPYVNNVPHLGNLIGAVLSADVFARYARSRGHDVLYICGADEHGTATETKAKEEGVTPQELCDKYVALHKKIYDWFGISFDIFGRTSLENHHNMSRSLFKQVLENGYIEEQTVTQPYCASCQGFLADRFIEGTCPHCGYEEARGDQCDNCGKLLNPSELKKPKCKVDGTTPEFRETDHLFLRLDKLQPVLENWVGKQSKVGGWSDNALRTTKAWFGEGLKPRAITRDLKWGINVPEDVFDGKYKDKVFYVWFDAPIGYISITEQLLGEGWKDWWQDNDVELVQFMGKDNIPFHSIIFPGTLMAASGQEGAASCTYKLVDTLNVTEYLNYEHGKFSKSRGVGVFGDNAQDSGIPADVFRFVLLYNRPETADTQFTWQGLQERLNNELVANFGNLVNRTIAFTNRFFEGKVVALDEKNLTADAQAFRNEAQKLVTEYLALLDDGKLREGLNQFLKISSLGNGYFQASEPWKTRNDNPEKAQQDLALLVNFVKDLAILSAPYMPTSAQAIFDQLRIEAKTTADLGALSIGNHTLGEAKLLFAKLEDERVEELKTMYGGTEQQVHGGQEKEQKKQKEEKMADKPINLQVGKITEVLPHPNAEKLFIERVDFAEGEPVQIVSGLKGHYDMQDLVGKHIVVVRNLKPAKLRGEWSDGMLLAAEDSEGTVAVIQAPQAQPGDRVTFEGNVLGSEVPQLTIDEFFAHSFELKDGIVTIDGKKMCVEGGLVADKGLMNGKVS